MTRQWIAVFLSISIFWYAATIATMIFGFSFSMRGFDTGEPTPFLGSLVIALSKILAFPIFLGGPKLGQLFPGLWGHIPFLLNSILWGMIFTFGIHRLVERNKTRAASSDQHPCRVTDRSHK